MIGVRLQKRKTSTTKDLKSMTGRLPKIQFLQRRYKIKGRRGNPIKKINSSIESVRPIR